MSLDLVKQTTEGLLDRLGIKAQVEVSESENAVEVDIRTEESGLLIGYHGENLADFQLILSLVLYKKLGQWQRVLVDVGGYRRERGLELTRMANEMAQRVKETGTQISSPYLNAADRRVMHLALSEDPEVETFSEGEGYNRRLIIRLKQEG